MTTALQIPRCDLPAWYCAGAQLKSAPPLAAMQPIAQLVQPQLQLMHMQLHAALQMYE
jgi:hypothetical protein